MQDLETTPKPDLGIADRLRRTRGRAGRRSVVSTKVTKTEQEQLEAVAKGEGKVLSEWAREVLLEQARGGANCAAVFTEVVALRMLLNSILRPVAFGERMTPEAYAQVLAEVRTGKHEAAQDMLSKYHDHTGGK